MAEKRDRRPRNEEQPDLLENDDVRGTAEDEDAEFEDIDSEDEELDEDLLDEEASGQQRSFTSEIGSEGGSTESLERGRAQSGISRGSESTETGRPSGDPRSIRERK